MRKCGIEIESLSAHRVPEKLADAGIEVLGAEKTQKNAITVWVNGKDRKKVFAILRNSCYNIKKVRYRGLERLKREGIRSVGFVAGALLFLLGVGFMQSRVLKIEIVGSGAYYEREIAEILDENGAALFSAFPAEHAAITSRILALPRVSFCSLGKEGGILTVTVEVNDENALLEGTPLLVPAEGIVEELTVVRGTPLVQVGDRVASGQIAVDCHAPVGESGTRSVLVIARIAVRYSVSKEYALGEREALAQALLDFGELRSVQTTPTEQGTLVTGEALAEAAINLN